MPSFVSASLCMALLSVIIVPSFVLASHRLALDLYSIVGLSVTSPGSHVPQHMVSASRQSPGSHARSDVPSSSYPQFVPHPRFAQA